MTAGEVCSRLTGVGADLSLMVVSWAELGYLYIDRDDSGRIFLRKRMGMGNERSAFENHCFRMLFRKRRYVDGTGYHYAQLCRKIREDGANVKGQYLRGSGNPKLFRLLCCGVGAAAGAAMGIHLGGSTIWRMVLAAALGLLCAMASWQIQRACRFFRLGRKPAMPVGLICGGSMVLLALLTHTLGLTVLSLLVQLLGGLGAAYGGRRTPAARQRAGELLGLRHYMKTVSRQELQRVLKTNPDYYYALAPYALALGVDRAFARQLGNERLPNCPYLITGVYAATAMRWYPQLRDAADTLDAQQKRMKRQHFLKF